MAQCLIIHKGITCPDALAEAGEEFRGMLSIQYRTARLGAAATDAGDDPEVVFTDSDAVARYWSDKGVRVRRPGSLPDWMPKADTLAAAGLSSVEEVRRAADAGILSDVQGIGDAYVSRITDALDEHGR